MKIKIFGSKNLNELERMVNDFCEEHDVIDVRHTALFANSFVIDRVFVIYNDHKKESNNHNCIDCKYASVPSCSEPCNSCSAPNFNRWEAGE